MKKIRKYLIIISIVILLLVGGFFTLYNVFRDKNGLNVIERTWINNNKSNIISVNVQGNLNNFSADGEGVFYDFIDDIEHAYGIEINPTVINKDESANFGFNRGFNIGNNDLVFYIDNYVLISKSSVNLASTSDLKDQKIGMISSVVDIITHYYSFASNSIVDFDSVDSMVNSLEDGRVNYIVLPLNEYKDIILEKDFNINYHLDDIKIYYYFSKSEDSTINSIFTKFYNNWSKDSLEASYYKHNYTLFLKSLNISEAEETTLSSKDYVVGVVEQYPYQIMHGGKYSGIVNRYLSDFSKFANVDFKYKKYKNSKALNKAIVDTKVNLAFNSYNTIEGLNNILTNINLSYVIIENTDNKNIYNSIYGLNGNVYVLENTKLANYLSGISNINVKTYKNNKALKKLMKKGYTIALDKLTYETYASELNNNYSVRLDKKVSGLSYGFIYNGSDTFSKLFSKYIMTLNNSAMTIDGVVDFRESYTSSNTAFKIAEYILILFAILIILAIHFIRKSRKIVLKTRIKKDEKLRYIDMLTSLKNRNYLNEKIEIWNQNTIYPQAIIAIDLNKIKYLNDTLGHEEGDKQIQSAANVLIKTQLDNTEIMRTDGTEFMVYMVDYSEKQVISYIKKILKEFKQLPYDYSAAIGFSMISDDLKLVEDAINEASEMMRENKANAGDTSEDD